MSIKIREFRRDHTPEECAYIAGIIDTCASFKISKNPDWSYAMMISSTNRSLIDYMDRVMGTKVLCEDTTPRPGRMHNDKLYMSNKRYVWSVYGILLDYVLEITNKYLNIQKGKSDLMIKFRNTYNKSGLRTIVTQDIIKQREDLFAEFRKLYL